MNIHSVRTIQLIIESELESLISILKDLFFFGRSHEQLFKKSNKFELSTHNTCTFLNPDSKLFTYMTGTCGATLVAQRDTSKGGKAALAS